MNNLKAVRTNLQASIEEASSKLRDQRPTLGGSGTQDQGRLRLIGNTVHGIGLRGSPTAEQQHKDKK